MRTHLLRNLPIAGKEKATSIFRDFDLYNLGRVDSIAVTRQKDDSAADVLLIAQYTDPATAQAARVTLRFGGARQVVLPELTPMFHLSELEIEDVSADQLEGVRFRTTNFGMARFEVLSSEVEILECTPE